jgi:hypothetical protein
MTGRGRNGARARTFRWSETSPSSKRRLHENAQRPAYESRGDATAAFPVVSAVEGVSGCFAYVKS